MGNVSEILMVQKISSKLPLPPLMEELGLAEVEHNPSNNRMRAK